MHDLAPGAPVVSATASRSYARGMWPALLRTAWMFGVAVVLVWSGAAVVRCVMLRRRGLLWREHAGSIQELAGRMGVRRPVTILLHENVIVPATLGWRRPAILFPADAATWADDDVRRAMVHELGHIRRADWPVHLLAHAVCAALWFHPLVWMALRRLHLEAERACDDLVVQIADHTDYAEQLVRLAQRLSTEPARPLLAMARRSDLSTRVTSILDTRVARGHVGRVTAAAVLVAACVGAAAVSPLRAAAVAAAPRPGSSGDTAGQSVQQRPSRALDRALVETADEADIQGMADLLAAGADVNAAVDGDGSPLIAAARSGSGEAVSYLLDRGADPNLGVTGDGNPLIMAAVEGHASVVELLLNRGARVDDVVRGDENALIGASAAGHLPVVQLLVQRGADVNARVWAETVRAQGGGEWRTPLSMARRGGHQPVVDFLISAGARE